MQDVMIDIETVSTESNAAICSIAAVKFTRGETTKLEELDHIYCKVSIESCTLLGMNTDPNTMEWWDSQSEDVRYEAIENPIDRLDIKSALEKLTTWLGPHASKIKVWSHGDDFDCVILSNAYKVCNMKTPWSFWNTRDTRTIYDIANIRLENVYSNKHHPLYDCYNQIHTLNKCIFKLFQN